MTLIGLFRAAIRAWIVVLMGSLITLAVAFHSMSAPGVYWAQADVVFLVPASAYAPNTLQRTSQSVIATAGLIQREVSGGAGGVDVVSSGVTIVGEGITSGYSIRLPNDGGQWANNFDRPLLTVQVVERSPQEADATMARILAEINTSLYNRQVAAGVDADQLIRTLTNPPSIATQYTAGNRKGALLGTLLLGLGLTGGAVVLTDDRRRRRLTATGAKSAADVPRTASLADSRI